MQISNFTVKEQIYESSKVKLFRATDPNQKPFVLKVLNKEYPSKQEISILQREFDILQRVQSKNVIGVFNLLNFQNQYLLILEDIQGESLAKILENQTLHYKDFLELAIPIVNGIKDIHSKNIIHKDIKPHNIIYNSKTGTLKLIDFDNSTVLSRENPSYTTKILEGTMHYISPEQTGRMNRTIDYRTDFYSLGVVFFQMLTGQFPFSGEDVSELMYSHIAIKPPNPSSINPEVPEVLSEITLKLMEKLPEQRYQDAGGLLYDLNYCKQLLETNQSITYFPISQKDFSKKFQIPEKIYGRNKELELLTKSYNQILQNEKKVNLTCISGVSGIGKTALIQELHKPIAETKAFFASGKFDQLNKDIPYSAFLQAFKEIVKQILTEPDYTIQQWKKKFLSALNENAQIVIDLIPELATIIGPQQPVEELPPKESENRTILVLTSFLKALASPDSPVVLFLDDMQWSDSGSVRLLTEYLQSYDLSHLYIICAYRTGELSLTHPFQILLEKLNLEKYPYQTIELQPLSSSIIIEILADTLHASPQECKDLAEIISQKTGGNPFFIYSYLKSLHKEELINPKEDEKGWTWDLEKIKKTQITENVVHLLSKKIINYTPDTLHILKLISCVGTSIEINFLLLLTEKDSLHEIISLLEKPVEDGIILVGENEIQLSHDKIKETVYGLLEEKEKSKLHYQIGKKLYTYFKHEEEKIFDITEQLNLGLNEISSLEEQLYLVELNLKSASKAKLAGSFPTSLKFLKKSEEVLFSITPEPWEKYYEISSELFTELAQVYYLNKNYPEAEKLFELVLEKSQTTLEKAKVVLIQIILYSSINKYHEALSLGTSILNNLKVEIPKEITQEFVGELFGKVMQKIGTKKISELVHFPLLQDEEKQVAIKILASCTPPAYMAQPALLPVLVLKIVEISLEYGNSPLSAYGYCLLGMITGSGLGNYNLGEEFGSLALSLLHSLQTKAAKCNTLFIYASMIVQWKKHAKEGLEHFIEAIQAGISEGDLQFASYSLIHHNYRLFFVRENLPSALQTIEKYKPVILELKQKDSTLNYFMWWKTLENLNASYPNYKLSNEFFPEEESLEEWKSSNNSSSLFYYYTGKIATNYLFGNYAEAYKFCELAEPHITGAFGMMHVPEMRFWESITLLKLLNTDKNNSSYLEKVKNNLTFFKNLMENCEDNYSHKYYILEGELAKLTNDSSQTLHSFSLAIELAEKYNYILEEAIAHEFAVEYWLQKENSRYANYHLEMALKCYTKWGCPIRVTFLKNQYPKLISQSRSKTLTSTLHHTQTTSESLYQTTPYNTYQATDIQSILKSMKILAGEVDLTKLLQKFMQILAENAGAERGILLLFESQNTKKELFIQAEFNITKKQNEVLQSLPFEKYKALPQSLIRYVERTWEDIVLDSAVHDNMFGNDPYIQENNLKSVFCIPIVLKGELIGILYLENNLNVGAFTTDRIQTLNSLVGQAAISIENARLYTNLNQLNLHLKNLNSTYEKFVPKQLLEFLGKKSILDIKLADAVQKEMAIFFSDIRNFTSMSEKMSPKDNFEFLNSYLKRIGPVIRKHGGFIDKYIGDAIMALFHQNTEGALQAAIELHAVVTNFNAQRVSKNLEPIKVGIGIHVGECMLGTIGEQERMDGTVISDAVNLASRLESLTKVYNSKILISESVVEKLKNTQEYKLRILGNVAVRGKEKKILIYEVLDPLSKEEYDAYLQTEESYKKAIQSLLEENYDRASYYFQVVLNKNPHDLAARVLLEESQNSSRRYFIE